MCSLKIYAQSRGRFSRGLQNARFSKCTIFKDASRNAIDNGYARIEEKK